MIHAGVLQRPSHRHESDRVAQASVTLGACRRRRRLRCDEAVLTLEEQSRSIDQRHDEEFSVADGRWVDGRLQTSVEFRRHVATAADRL